MMTTWNAPSSWSCSRTCSTVSIRTWSQMSERLAGLTVEEYLWEPAAGCWTVHPDPGGGRVDEHDPEADPAPMTTIAWRMWHIAVDCLDSYSSRVFNRTGTGLTGTTWVLDPDEALTLLELAWRVFREGLATGGTDRLFDTLGPDWGPYADSTMLALALHAQREVTRPRRRARAPARSVPSPLVLRWPAHPRSPPAAAPQPDPQSALNVVAPIEHRGQVDIDDRCSGRAGPAAPTGTRQRSPRRTAAPHSCRTSWLHAPRSQGSVRLSNSGERTSQPWICQSNPDRLYT